MQPLRRCAPSRDPTTWDSTQVRPYVSVRSSQAETAVAWPVKDPRAPVGFVHKSGMDHQSADAARGCVLLGLVVSRYVASYECCRGGRIFTVRCVRGR